MDIGRPKKWYPPQFVDDDGKPEEGAPYLKFRTASGSRKNKFVTDKARLCREIAAELSSDLEEATEAINRVRASMAGDLDDEEQSVELHAFRQRARKLRLRLAAIERESTPQLMAERAEGFELVMELCLDHVVDAVRFSYCGSQLDWHELPEETDEDEPSRRLLLDKLGDADALFDLAHSIYTGLTPEEKKASRPSSDSDTDKRTTSGATAPSAQDSPDSETSG